jgi:thiol-disulfide isomerase/thioredoxin
MKRLTILLLALLAATPLLATQTTITGKLLGSDGKPMPKAHIHIATGEGKPPIASVEVAKDGSYFIQTNMRGMLLLQFTGANHQMHAVPLIVDAPREVLMDVRLGTPEMIGKLDDVKIIGDFNDFDFSDGAIPLKKQKDGTYRATISTREKKLAYQLVFASDVMVRSINGTMTEEYQYDGGGDYRSIVTSKKGKITITFDPKKLPLNGETAVVLYRDSTTARLGRVITRIQERNNTMIDAIRARIRNGEDLENFSYDWSNDIAELNGALASERDPLLRQALLFSYVELENQGAPNLDSTVARQALTEITPMSPFWSVNPGTLGAAIRLSGNETGYDAYRWEVITKHPDTTTRVNVLYDAVQSIPHADAPERFMRYYTALTENYGDAQEARYARAEYSPTRNIQVGRIVPEFSLPSLDNPGSTISNESMKGKLYLIDFWATWCGPCVAEMGNIHKAYEKYRNRGFEIVSLSFDRAPQDIAKFRNGTWKMPWMHAFVEGNFDSELAERFEVIGIPKPILIDNSGKIIAAGNELRGSALDRTLARILGQAN